MVLLDLHRMVGVRKMAKVHISRHLDVQRGFLGLACVSDQAGQQMYHEMQRTAMTCMFDLTNVFQLIVDRFNQ